MKLTYSQASRYCRLFDLLSIYAHKRLRVVTDYEFCTGELPRSIDEQGQRETMHEVWANPQLIEDYTRENPDHLSMRDLAIINSWTACYTGYFFIDRCDDGVLRFSTQNRAFEVCGISREIEEMLPEMPAVVHTTLLPFQDFIVYDQGLRLMQIEFGMNMLQSFKEELDAAVASGAIFSTGQQLIELAPIMKQESLDAQMEEFRHDMEMEERAQGPLEGQHRGALDGLDEATREQAIRAHMKELDEARKQKGEITILNLLDEHCTPGPVRSSLLELLHTEELPTSEQLTERIDKLDLGDIAATDGEKAALEPYMDELYQRMRETAASADPAEFIATRLTTPDMVQAALEGMGLKQVQAIRKLTENDGTLRYEADNITTLAGLPSPQSGICYLFHDGDAYTFVMPDEVLPLARQVDWEALEWFERTSDELIRFFEALLELRGMALYAQAIDEYVATVPDGFDDPELINELLFEAVNEGLCSICMLATSVEDEVYLLHYELMDEYQASKGIPRDKRGPYEESELDELLEGLLAQQKGKEPRPVQPEMLSETSLFEWKLKQPPTLAMRNFLDAHVPDGADDYFFAEDVIEDLLDEAMWGLMQGSVQAFFDILERHGFFPDESQLNQLIQLWQNLCNALPIWPNNGWSPLELMSRSSERRVFFNPDGSVMKVGRNDPCPCGSGKKYKRCCGR